MTLSTINKSWAVAQIIALTLTFAGAAFPAVVSADQSNFNNSSNGGHDQNSDNVVMTATITMVAAITAKMVVTLLLRRRRT